MTVHLRLSRAFVEAHPREAARVLERLPADEAAATLRRLPAEAAAPALAAMEPNLGAACLECWADTSVAAVLVALPAAGAARVVARMGEPGREELLARVPGEVAGPIRQLLRHPEGTAGALMDPRVLALPDDVTAEAARRRVQQHARGVFYYLYVTDREQRLAGVLNLRQLMLAPARQTLAALMRPQVERLSVHARREAILAHPGWRSYHALPVVDAAGVLVGALRYETLRELEGGAAAGAPVNPLVLGLALGELYWATTSALLRGTLDLLTAAAGRRVTEEKSDGK